ncbi:hypothetical protein EM308_01140 [Flavobacterium gilvum]|uniref:Uncharacterized protein n=1 Tax=Flavobacterium gilvum TaxID=1492737 RepID=A0AAC9I2J9_9FLAO|nr:hypothetical protein EM308_01140 [Flavobacterium gilvum]
MFLWSLQKRKIKKLIHFFLNHIRYISPYKFVFECLQKCENISFLAPIEVEILVGRGSAHKIVADSGTNAY